MYIWFRMYYMMLKTWWQNKRHGYANIFDTTECTTHTYWNDVDFNFHVNNGRINTIADLGRMHYFVRTGLLRYALKNGVRPMVGDITAKYRREINAFQKITILTRLVVWEGKWAFMEHRIVRNGRVVANVVIRGVFTGQNGPIPPETLLEHFAPDAHDHAQIPDWVLDWHHSMEGMSQQLRAEESLS